MDTTDELHGLLDEELAFSPTFLGRYSNHTAMALVALHQMGAPADRLKAELARHAAQEAEPREDQEVLAERVAEVRRDGIEAVVRARAPALVSGPGSQFFHPMIRLAYALGVRHDGQVATALLDWETRFEVAHPVDDGIPRPDNNLDSLSSFALAAHITADEFVTLHMVTGARALRVVSAWLDTTTAQDLVTYGAWALASAYQYVDSPGLVGRAEMERLRESSPPSRQQIAEAAIESTDAHVIKLADVALTEEQRTGDPLYRFIGARVVGLADRV